MKTISLIILGVVLLAAIHATEAGGKKGKAKCTDEEKKEAAQELEDCVAGKAGDDDTAADEKKYLRECKKELKKGGACLKGDGLNDIMDKFKGAIDKVVGGFKKGAGGLKDKLKGAFDSIVSGIGGNLG